MQQPATIPENIVLIGFMGSGKSTVGRELRKLLNYPLIDMDSMIEERAAKPITRIFEEDGESAFRGMESSLLDELAATSGPCRIIATGGGVVVRPENRERLRKLGFVVWLCAPATVILQRTRNNTERPLLLTDDPSDRIQTLLMEREPWYRQCAHLKVDTIGLSSREIAVGILESARYFFVGNPPPPCKNP